jgi:hypothetical protein
VRCVSVNYEKEERDFSHFRESVAEDLTRSIFREQYQSDLSQTAKEIGLYR